MQLSGRGLDGALLGVLLDRGGTVDVAIGHFGVCANLDLAGSNWWVSIGFACGIVALASSLIEPTAADVSSLGAEQLAASGLVKNFPRGQTGQSTIENHLVLNGFDITVDVD